MDKHLNPNQNLDVLSLLSLASLALLASFLPSTLPFQSISFSNQHPPSSLPPYPLTKPPTTLSKCILSYPILSFSTTPNPKSPLPQPLSPNPQPQNPHSPFPIPHHTPSHPSNSPTVTLSNKKKSAAYTTCRAVYGGKRGWEWGGLRRGVMG